MAEIIPWPGDPYTKYGHAEVWHGQLFVAYSITRKDYQGIDADCARKNKQCSERSLLDLVLSVEKDRTGEVLNPDDFLIIWIEEGKGDLWFVFKPSIIDYDPRQFVEEPGYVSG